MGVEKTSGSAPQDVAEAVATAHRGEWATVIAATVRLTRDLDLAEECAQEAYARALQTWGRDGIPRRPVAWLITTAANRARDVLRRETAWRRLVPQLVIDAAVPAADLITDPPVVPDDRLRLIFICCHPALAREAQVALTLRLLGGLSTVEVARAFLVQESTMAARITRAKKKISTARIPYRVPGRDELPGRVAAVLEVLHLVFTTGHTAPVGEQLVRVDLVDRAVALTRLVRQLLPDDPEVRGLLALMLLVDARRGARLSEAGALVLLVDQDRRRWDRVMIEEGEELVRDALTGHPPGRYAVQAAIAALHAASPSWSATDWTEIVGLYDVLRQLWPSSVVELNRAVAIGLRDGPAAGLIALDLAGEDPVLADYGYLEAARADFLRRLGRWSEAAASYRRAVSLTGNEVERTFLVERLAEVERSAGRSADHPPLRANGGCDAY